MTERDQSGLRGPVRACRLQRTAYSRQCGAAACETEERTSVSTQEFREDGALVRYWHQSHDGSEWTSSYEYNDAGQRTTLRIENSAGHVNLQFYEYDTAGRLVRVIARHLDGGDRITASYEFDAAGDKKKIVYVDVAAQPPDTSYTWRVEGIDSCYSVPGAATLAALYNEHGKPTALIFTTVRTSR